MSSTLRVISGGAAQGLVTQLQPAFEARHGCSLNLTFGAVGMMKDRLQAGQPCDLLILTEALVRQLQADGILVAGTDRALGAVRTGVAVKAGDPAPRVATPDELRAALVAARGVYFPDPVKSTAGIHFMGILRQLGLAEEISARLRPFPNGATAMKAMSESSEDGLLGCTQITEISFTPGVDLVAALPAEFELATVYTAALCSHAAQAGLARELIAQLASDQSLALRQSCGFEV